MLFFIYLSDLELFAHLEPQGKIWKLFSRGSHHKPKKNNGNSVFKKKILALFSRGSHHKPKTKKTRKSRFQIEYIGIIFQRLPSQAQKATEIPFSKRRFWHYFPKAPITSQKKPPKSRFHMKFSSQAKKTTEIPFSNRRYWHYFPKVSLTSLKNHGKHGKLVFK